MRRHFDHILKTVYFYYPCALLDLYLLGLQEPPRMVLACLRDYTKQFFLRYSALLRPLKCVR